MHAVDLDGDGDPDVVSESASGGGVAWHENLSDHGDDHGGAADATATLATALPAFLHGTLESGGDRDVFRFATGAGTLRVYSNGPTDTYGRLLDADGGELASNDDEDDKTRNFAIEAEVAAGIHYVEVRGFDGGTTGAYTLSVEFESDDPGAGVPHGDDRRGRVPGRRGDARGLHAHPVRLGGRADGERRG